VTTTPAPEKTLLAVHAHPDDESTSTGGVLAHYADAGYRTVVITCTNGEFGDGPGGVKPGAAGHDPQAVADTRRAELHDACRLLGVSDVEMLGYHDSGMADWSYRDRPDVFVNIPVEQAAERVGALIERYRPAVVVTYDPHTTYQHPDHIHAARVATRAVEATGLAAKLYYKAHGTRYWSALHAALRQVGVDRAEPDTDLADRMAVVQRRITTTVDTTAVVARKRAGLMAHRSQLDSSMAARLTPELFAAVFGVETYIRAVDTTGAETPEHDLFAGVPLTR
jgi:LmbE family N-acetylglucosaminyl deacetylase